MSQFIQATNGRGVVAHRRSDAEINFYLQLLSSNHSLTAQASAVEYFRHLLIQDHVPPTFIADTLYDFTSNGGLEELIACASENDGEIRDQVFWTLGNIALDCSLCRTKVRETIALPLMIEMLVSPAFIDSKWKHNLVWALSQIVRGGIHTLDIVFVQSALRGLCSVLHLGDSKLKIDAVWAIAYIADDAVGGIQIDAVLHTPQLLHQLLELVECKETRRPALRALGSLVAGGDDQTQIVLDAGLLPRVIKVFRNNIAIGQKREIVWILSNIAAGSSEQIDMLFDTDGIVELLMNTFDCDDCRIRKEVGWTVANALTGANIDRSRWLCSSNILHIVPELLNLRNERNLIERTLFALEVLVEKRITHIPVLQYYKILQKVREIAESSPFDTIIKIRAERILYKENVYKKHIIPANTYSLNVAFVTFQFSEQISVLPSSFVKEFGFETAADFVPSA
ncbi:unnamed protein product [Thelazia callipaeda]|uniref:Importin subunit alpha n=1 Tax=Thelazia callipaeda TaxID=103827 RepID=A0A0N5DBV2_THECL|nr:unnamed protein product [Thelazia callipaeda]